MKQSHLNTPRTLAETSFTTGYMDIKPVRSLGDKAVMWASVIGFVAVVLVVLFAPEIK